MKKKLIILLIIIIGLGFSLWYVADYYLLNYSINISLEDLYEYKSENIESEDLRNEDFDIDLQNNTETTDESDNLYSSEEDNTNIENSSNNEALVSPKNLEQQIVDKYTLKFTALKNESLSRLNALLSQAKQEYNDTPSNKKTTAKIALGYKYLRLGRNLEKEIDAKFNSILSDMRNELIRNGLPTTSVDEARKAYNNEKNERRSYLMEKALSNS